MKLTLTIQDVTDKETNKTFKGLFGTLITDKHTQDHAEKMKNYEADYTEYSKQVQSDEDSPAIEPTKPQLTGVNFVTTLAAVEGLEGIVKNLIKEATNLK